MRKNEPITLIMTKDPLTVHHGDPISKLRKIFAEHKIHHLPVVSGKELIGIVTWSDFLRVSFGAAFGTDEKAVDATLDHTLTLEDVMTRNPLSISVNGSIREAAQLLGDHDFHALPVVSGKELVGIVSSKDLIKHLLSLY